MGKTFTTRDELTWFEQVTDLSMSVFAKLIDGGEAQLAEVKAKWPAAVATGNADELEDLSADAAWASAFIADAADLALVGMYHRTEGLMKDMLSRLLRGSNQSFAKVAKMNEDGLRQTFKQHGIQVEIITQESTVTTMRRFANSWKHNADAVDDKLCQNLSLPIPSTFEAHLADETIRDAMGARVKLAPGSSAGDIVRAYAPAAILFVKELARACP